MISIPTLPNYTIGVSTRNEGDIRFADIDTYLTNKTKKKIVKMKLQHGSQVYQVDGKEKEVEADAVITSKDIALSMVVGDCIPIIIIDSKKQIHAMIHAGWRSLLQNILPLTLAKLQYKFDSQPKNWFAWIGPGLRVCHNTFSMEPLQKQLPEWEKHIALGNNFWSVDYVQYSIDTLKKFGIQQQRIFDDDSCTYCKENDFWSHRRATQTGDTNGRFVVSVWRS